MIVYQLLTKVSIVRYGIIPINSYFDAFKNVEKKHIENYLKVKLKEWFWSYNIR